MTYTAVGRSRLASQNALRHRVKLEQWTKRASIYKGDGRQQGWFLFLVPRGCIRFEVGKGATNGA